MQNKKREQGIICKSPKECLTSAFRFGLIENEEYFFDMLEDRNCMSHIYSKEDSEAIYLNIKNEHVSNFNKLLKNLKKYL